MKKVRITFESDDLRATAYFTEEALRQGAASCIVEDFMNRLHVHRASNDEQPNPSHIKTVSTVYDALTNGGHDI
jgi:hypothetical protein